MVVIICDATKEIGYGHVKRCLTLASFYRQLGIGVMFLMRTALPVVKNLLFAHDVGVVVRSSHEECWSYLFEKKDQIRLVIIDHYEISADLEKKIFGVFPILVMDDLCRAHWCDVLVDHTIHRKVQDYDKKLYNPFTRSLLGIQYALIDSVYQGVKTNGDNCNILLTFGATDPEKAVLKVLEVLEPAMEKRKVVFHVPLSSLSPCLDPLKKMISRSGMDIRLYQDLPHLCCLYERCGIAIGAPGTSLLERMYCGLINITIAVAQNQREVGQNFAHNGRTIGLGNIKTFDSLSLARVLGQMIDSPDNGFELQKRTVGMVDGKGVIRIIGQTLPFISPVSLRLVNRSDGEILYQWQHQKGARKYFKEPRPPTKQEHQAWFDNVLLRDDVTLNIIEWCNRAIGYVRLNGKGKTKEVSILIAQNFQGLGFAKSALIKMIKTKNQVYTAVVHPANKASMGLFASAGFYAMGKGEYRYNAVS